MNENPVELILEACVDSLAAALDAQQRGAHRIELCAQLDLDGLTPARELVMRCRRQLSIPLMVMVRPRAGDFVYAPAELAAMEREIGELREIGVAGVVFGALTGAHTVDVSATRRLAAAASPLAVTFHKAIDATRDVLEAFRELNAIAEVGRVLTSGGAATAWAGRDAIRAMQSLPGRRLTIIAAGSVLADNRQQIADYTGVRELHGRRIV